MTEAEWLACTDPWLLEESLGPRFTYRRRLLTAAAGLRRIADRIPHADPEGLLARVESVADGGLTADEFGSAGGEILACRDDPVGGCSGRSCCPRTGSGRPSCWPRSPGSWRGRRRPTGTGSTPGRWRSNSGSCGT